MSVCLDEGQSTRELYEGLGVANDMVFFRMNKNAYEHCWIDDERIDLPAGMEEFQASLAQKFPQEKKTIKKIPESYPKSESTNSVDS